VEKAVSGGRNVVQASIINVSTIMSSNTIAPSLPFFCYDYQCSKAALNMYTVIFSAEMAKSNIFITALHPGWVQTDMGGKDATLTLEQASKNIVECITALKDEHYGKLIDSTSGSKCNQLPF
jgi:NAD(P)-dependent dehydrogenase (short-subunit alcohol dehydrogenase family)